MKNDIAINFYSGVISVACFALVVEGYETCSTNWFYSTYCEDGYYCCDSGCCSYGLGAAVIAGIVIGSIIFIAVVVSLCAVCVFGCGKHRGSTGNVINPQPGTQMHVISTGITQPVAGQPYGAPVNQTAIYPPVAGTSYPQHPPPYSDPVPATKQ